MKKILLIILTGLIFTGGFSCTDFETAMQKDIKTIKKDEEDTKKKKAARFGQAKYGEAKYSSRN